MDSISEISLLTNKRKSGMKLGAPHTGYPIPDPVLGRPKIEWLVCAHSGCYQHFSSGQQLINHLNRYNRYKPYMHVEHENCVTNNGLTPEKVLEQGLTKCPS